jgi:hypothetical protein
MALSAFTDKSKPPSPAELRAALGKAHTVWEAFLAAAAEQVSPLKHEWGFTSASTGWGLRLKCKDRVIVYVTPGEGSFRVSFALGEKAVAAAHASKLPAALLKVIDAAPRYAEGRGVRIETRQLRQVAGLAKLARIKHES